jgi:hypothetical protein
MKFECDEIVRIHSTNSEMDGQTCKVLGIAFKFPEMCHFIVQLETPIMIDGFLHKALQMTEHCLEKI